jgi:hypothetical protein
MGQQNATHGLWVPFLWPKNFMGQLFLACCLIDMQVGHSLLAHRNPKVAAVQAVRVLFEGQTNNEKKKNEQKRSHSALLHQWVCAQALMVRQVLPCN